tara:strand:- start:11 stop:226 length:216 start_codon:yes stop_codon:yes gene_type:complete
MATHSSKQKLTNDIVYLEKIDKNLLECYHKNQIDFSLYVNFRNRLDLLKKHIKELKQENNRLLKIVLKINQ